MKKEQKLLILNVKHEIKNCYYQKKYRYYIKGKWKQFEKDHTPLCRVYEKKE